MPPPKRLTAGITTLEKADKVLGIDSKERMTIIHFMDENADDTIKFEDERTYKNEWLKNTVYPEFEDIITCDSEDAFEPLNYLLKRRRYTWRRNRGKLLLQTTTEPSTTSTQISIIEKATTRKASQPITIQPVELQLTEKKTAKTTFDLAAFTNDKFNMHHNPIQADHWKELMGLLKIDDITFKLGKDGFVVDGNAYYTLLPIERNREILSKALKIGPVRHQASFTHLVRMLAPLGGVSLLIMNSNGEDPNTDFCESLDLAFNLAPLKTDSGPSSPDLSISSSITLAGPLSGDIDHTQDGNDEQDS